MEKQQYRGNIACRYRVFEGSLAINPERVKVLFISLLRL
jgi:hypothetical protein